MTDRIACCVPFCRRTRGQRKGEPPIREGDEWICGPHWRLVSKKIKTLRAKVRRKHRLNRYNHGHDLDAWLWREAKRQAIERAAGL